VGLCSRFCCQSINLKSGQILRSIFLVSSALVASSQSSIPPLCCKHCTETFLTNPVICTRESTGRSFQISLDWVQKREAFPDLAPILWHSCGTIAALLQEIVSIYPMLSPPTLTAAASNRVCNALALLQCVASHPDTRGLFLNGESWLPFSFPFFSIPFLGRSDGLIPRSVV
jgi:hypothetical protein